MERTRPKNPVLSIREDIQAWLAAIAAKLGWYTSGRMPVRMKEGMGTDSEPRPAVSAVVQAALAFVATIDEQGHRYVTSSAQALELGLKEIRRREAQENGKSRIRIKPVDSSG